MFIPKIKGFSTIKNKITSFINEKRQKLQISQSYKMRLSNTKTFVPFSSQLCPFEYFFWQLLSHLSPFRNGRRRRTLDMLTTATAPFKQKFHVPTDTKKLEKPSCFPWETYSRTCAKKIIRQIECQQKVFKGFDLAQTKMIWELSSLLLQMIMYSITVFENTTKYKSFILQHCERSEIRLFSINGYLFNIK